MAIRFTYCRRQDPPQNSVYDQSLARELTIAYRQTKNVRTESVRDVMLGVVLPLSPS